MKKTLDGSNNSIGALMLSTYLNPGCVREFPQVTDS